MNDSISWLFVLGAGGGGSIITFITFWMALSSRITAAQEKSVAAEKAAFEAHATANNSIARAELNAQFFNNFRVDVAEKISGLEARSETTAKALTQAETRLAKSIEDVGVKIDKLSETLIKTLGDFARHPKQ